MDPIKIKGITDWPVPTTLRELCSFLGFGNYYKDFIANYSTIAHPLHELTKKSRAWSWQDAEQLHLTHSKKDSHLIQCSEVQIQKSNTLLIQMHQQLQ